ncbi:MAG: fibronectin type III domain-containing protein [Elusimicrobia bacterium]|nr:fibronectin type III domain-containing protein [Elusimicrobiota bacterium]
MNKWLWGQRSLLMACLAMGLSAYAEYPTWVGEHVSVGQKVAELVGPGPAGAERYYASYIYEGTGGHFDLVSVDPLTGVMEVFPGPSEEGARGLAVGQDGKIYLGTVWHAKIMEFDPQTGTITDRGRPGGAYAETFIAEIASGPDGNIYAGTYPNAKLIRYRPDTKSVEDLGKMGEPNDQYVISVVVSTDGFVFGGTGPINSKIVAYKISTGERQVILTTNESGFVKLFHGRDGKIHAKCDDGRMYRLNGFNAPVSVNGFPWVYKNELNNGSRLNMPVGGFGDVTITQGTTTVKSFPFSYKGKPRRIMTFASLRNGPAMYCSGILDFNLFSLQDNTFTNIGYLGGGEAYTMIPNADSTKVLIAAYSGLAPLMLYDPAVTFNPGINPVFAGMGRIDSSWRPHTMVVLSSSVVVAGGQPGYGKFGGPLVKWNFESNVVETWIPIPNESPYSLVKFGGKIIGGTITKNGTGTTPIETQATLFIWDPDTKEVEYAIKMPGSVITNLVVREGFVYGFCDSKWFRFNPETRALVQRTQRGVWALSKSLVVMPDGNVWGLAESGIFKVDPQVDPAHPTINPVTVVLSTTALGMPLTAGFAAKGNDLYFASLTKLFKFTIPSPVPDTTPPTVHLNQPASGSIFSKVQTVSVKCTANDDTEVAKVWFLHNGVVVSTDTTVPFSYAWPITESDNGPHTLTATAFDAVGNRSTTAIMSVLVDIDATPPVAPVSLTALAVSSSSVHLSWSASTDNVGVAGYRVDVGLDAGFAGFVDGWNDLNVGSTTTVTVSGVVPDTVYYVRVRAFDGAGNLSDFRTVSVRTLPEASLTVDTARAYPVPYRPGRGATGVTFDRTPEGADIRLFTNDGRLVKTLAGNSSGMAIWDLTNDDGTPVASGVYLAIIEKNGARKKLKVVVQK